MKRHSQHGFTLVELLLAMAFFSFILLFVTTGFIIINRAYNKGITVKLVQDEARSTLELLTREIRTTPAGNITTTASCLTVGIDSYYWTEQIDGGDSKSPYRLLFQPGVNCSDRDVSLSTDLLSDRVGVQYMSVDTAAGNNALSITLILSTAETDIIDGGLSAAAKCSVESGSQYCDVVTMKTVVSPR